MHNTDIILTNHNDKQCEICFKSNRLRPYFKCNDSKHSICSTCFDKIESCVKSPQCPYCRSDLLDECKNPMSLSAQSLYEVDAKKIIQKYIFIHQNFDLDSSAKLITMDSGSDKIKLYTVNGNPIVWHKMFIGESGFMYIYDSKYERYTYAIERYKYQFWDKRRVYIDL